MKVSILIIEKEKLALNVIVNLELIEFYFDVEIGNVIIWYDTEVRFSIIATLHCAVLSFFDYSFSFGTFLACFRKS